MAVVAEPTAEQLGEFTNSPDNDFHPLHAICKWAGFPLGIKYKHSPGAVLLTNLGSEWVTPMGSESGDPQSPTITMDEFASTPAEEFEHHIDSNEWEFAKSSDPVMVSRNAESGRQNESHVRSSD